MKITKEKLKKIIKEEFFKYKITKLREDIDTKLDLVEVSTGARSFVSAKRKVTSKKTKQSASAAASA